MLAHTHFGQLIKSEIASGNSNTKTTAFLGRHIVIGTVVDTPKGAAVPHHIRTVVDMRDDLSPLLNETAVAGGYDLNDREGGI